jgi:DNA-binding transcriptional LysR family regulator
MRIGSSMTRPGLAALETFLAVARHRSFRRAALERGVTPSALSHVIRDLEEKLDVRLFNRTSRTIRVTEAGSQLLERIGPPLAEIAEAIGGMDTLRGRPAGLLRLNVPRVAAELVVQPIIARFLATYPDIRLEIASFDGVADIVAEGFDAGIRPQRLLDPGMIVVPVGPRRRFAVVGAPSYFAGRDPPTTPRDLHAHACIERRFPNGTRHAWEFARGGEPVEAEISGPLSADDSAVMIRAALDGVGLALVYEGFVAEHLARGDLVRVLDDWCPVLPPFFLYYPGRRQVSAPLRAFIDMARSPAA